MWRVIGYCLMQRVTLDTIHAEILQKRYRDMAEKKVKKKEERDFGSELYGQMLATANSFNALLQEQGEEFNMIGRDLAARLLSVVKLQSGDERIVMCPKLRHEILYIQERYHIRGGEAPDGELTILLQGYVKELETHIKEHDDWPQWVYNLFQERYKFKIYKP